MGNTSAISWTDATWNIATGCDKVDSDCKNCYMYRQSLNGTRFKPNQVVRTKTVFNLPLKYKETKSQVWDGAPLIFTSSFTDFFHKDIDSYRHEAWDIIRACPHLTFQILTKRPERIKECLPPDWGDGWDNVWLGTSVGSNAGIHRMVDLALVDAKIKFLSFEPLYERLKISTAMYKGFNVFPEFDWVIVGGESGNENGIYKYRPCEMEYIQHLVDVCGRERIPVFVKQVGTYLAKQLGMKDRHGTDINEFPDSIKVRQFPICNQQ